MTSKDEPSSKHTFVRVLSIGGQIGAWRTEEDFRRAEPMKWKGTRTDGPFPSPSDVIRIDTVEDAYAEAYGRWAERGDKPGPIHIREGAPIPDRKASGFADETSLRYALRNDTRGELGFVDFGVYPSKFTASAGK